MTLAYGHPLVSIITPVYNGAQYLDELILSVRNQDYQRIEHIIIDDGSGDNGATIAILEKYPHLRWWSRGNRGQYATMNEGLEAANGDLICFISADDTVRAGAVRQVVGLRNEGPQYDGILGLAEFMDARGAPFPIKFPFRTAPLQFYAGFSHISHCSLYLSRERLLGEKLFFDPALRYVGDYDWILRVLKTLRLHRVKTPLSRVRIHPDQMSTRHSEVMYEEQRGVMSVQKINPIFYYTLARIFGIAGGATFDVVRPDRADRGPHERPGRHQPAIRIARSWRRDSRGT